MHIQITNSGEPKIIGVTNGIYQMEINFEKIKPVYSLIMDTNMDDFLESQSEINSLSFDGVNAQLTKKAKITDIMVFSPFVFGAEYVVTSKFLSCLEKVGVSKNEYQAKKMSISGLGDDFYLLFVPVIPTTDICFSKSLIYDDDDDAPFGSKSNLNIKTYAKYLEVEQENPFISFEKISIDAKFSDSDILFFQASNDLFFSERLYDKLRQENVSSLIRKRNQISLDFSLIG